MSYQSFKEDRWNQSKKKKIRVSRWFITMNTNLTDKNITDKFKSAYEEIYAHLYRFIKYLDPDGNESKIIDREDDPTIGIGENQHRVHIHSLITIRHTTKIHLNYDMMRAFLRKYMGFECYLNGKSVHDNLINIKNYLEKNYKQSENA